MYRKLAIFFTIFGDFLKPEFETKKLKIK